MFLDKNLPPSTPVKKGATPKVSEVNVRDISVIESTPANLLKKSLLRKAMEGVEEEKVRMPHYYTTLQYLISNVKFSESKFLSWLLTLSQTNSERLLY